MDRGGLLLCRWFYCAVAWVEISLEAATWDADDVISLWKFISLESHEKSRLCHIEHIQLSRLPELTILAEEVLPIVDRDWEAALVRTRLAIFFNDIKTDSIHTLRDDPARYHSLHVTHFLNDLYILLCRVRLETATNWRIISVCEW